MDKLVTFRHANVQRLQEMDKYSDDWLLCRWVWAEAGAQMKVEEALNIGGFGYPVRIIAGL